MSHAIYRSEQIRQWEQRWFTQGNASYGLMQQAAWAVSQWIMQQHDKQTTCVVCGSGNNGGDGWLVAAYLFQAGWPVSVIYIGKGRSDDSKKACQYAQGLGVPNMPFADTRLSASLIVDAIFGIGLNREPTSDSASAIEQINIARQQHASTVIAVDIPSGVQSDSGHVWQDCAVNAHTTLCLLGLKSGLLTAEAKNAVGLLVVLSLIPRDAALTAFATYHDQPPRLPARMINSHKGSHGHALLIGGDLGMGGALLMASEAAVRSGAGKVSVLTRLSHIAPTLSRSPNIMSHGLTEDLLDLEEVLQDIMPRMNSVAIGMGLGRGEWGQQVWQAALPYLLDAETLPAVLVDADALYHLKETKNSVYKRNNSHWYCTPHAGEAARLLGCEVEDIEADRYGAVSQLQKQYGGQWLLKGAGSVVLDHAGLSVCGLGNAGMAVGGMGDVLAGLAAGLLAQFTDMPLIDVVCLHAAAGDLAAQQGQRGMTALDVVEQIRQVVA